MTGRYSYGEALARLSSAQKSAKGAPAYSRFVNRRLGRYLAAAAYRLRLSPNQVTGISALCSAAGIAVLALLPPSPPMAIAVCLTLVIGYSLDSADGQLARLTGRGSAAGEWLDHVVDCAKIFALHAAVLVSWFRFRSPDPWQLMIPLGFGFVATVLFFGMILRDQLREQARHSAASGESTSAPAGRMSDSAPPSTVRSILVLPTDYGLLCWVFLLYGAPAVFVLAYGLLFVGNGLFLIAALIKWFRDLAWVEAVRNDRRRQRAGHMTTMNQTPNETPSQPTNPTIDNKNPIKRIPGQSSSSESPTGGQR